MTDISLFPGCAPVNRCGDKMTTKGEKIASRFGAGRLAPSWPVLDVAQTGTVGDGPLLLMEIVADVLISDGCHRAGVAATLNPTLPDETFAMPLGHTDCRTRQQQIPAASQVVCAINRCC